MSAVTNQFRATAIKLHCDLSKAFGRSVNDTTWIEGFTAPAIGNLAHECGGFKLMEEGKPTVKGSLGGISFAQWTGMTKGRRRLAFMQLCRKLRLHPYSYEAAIAMITAELTGAYKSAVSRTLDANVKTNTPKPKTRLMSRVVQFELIYEGAGVKHYPSRYQWAQHARTVISEWLAQGRPDPGPYIPPRGRFSADFDREFGPPKPSPYRAPEAKVVTETREALARVEEALTASIVDLEPQQAPVTHTTITAPVAGLEPKPQKGEAAEQTDPLPPTDPPLATPPLATTLPIPDGDTSGLPRVTVMKGRWPESFLTPAEIAVIQVRLREKGFVRVGTANGKWDSDMIGAISKMQADAGLTVDGHWGPETRAALANGVKPTIAPERANATPETLKAVGEPTLQTTAPVTQGSWWGGVAAAVSAAIGGITQALPDATEKIQPIKELLGDIPGWVWLLALAVVAFALYAASRKTERQVAKNFREGALTSIETPPPLPAGMQLVTEPPPWQGHAQRAAIEDARHEGEQAGYDIGQSRPKVR